jgi:pimeloyl-ACP methyl ester carboxylesterase
MFGRKQNDHNRLHEIEGCQNPSRKGDVIFVHGLGGNARSTWHPEERQDDNFWLSWLSKDIEDVGIWSFGYEAEPSKFKGSAMPIFDQASNLLEWIEIKGLGQKPLIFITHSLGGLLVKSMLNTAQTYRKQEIIEQTKGIVFLATPHTGSHLANLISKIGTIARTTVSVEELKSHSPQLRQLNEWYRENARNFGIVTKVYYETRPFNGILVVDEDSANLGIEGIKPIAVPEDHISIAKPKSKDNLVYLGVQRFIRENIQYSGIEWNSYVNCYGVEGLLSFEIKDSQGSLNVTEPDDTERQEIHIGQRFRLVYQLPFGGYTLLLKRFKSNWAVIRHGKCEDSIFDSKTNYIQERIAIAPVGIWSVPTNKSYLREKVDIGLHRFVLLLSQKPFSAQIQDMIFNESEELSLSALGYLVKYLEDNNSSIELLVGECDMVQ